jgi:branched-chain amino acid transport system ATP-binding protein
LEAFGSLTARENVMVALEMRRRWATEKYDMTATADELLERVGIGAVADKPVESLPTGTARLVELARALATEPRVLLLDEPSSGLDAHETSQLGSALRRVVDEEKVSMLLVEHDVAMVLGLSSSVTVLDFGLCIAQGTPDKIRNDPAVRSAYLGDDEAIEGSGSSEARDDPTDDAATGEPAIAAPAPDETVNDEAGATS